MNPFTLDILSLDEIPSLLALQKANLKANISAEEYRSQGFLTFPYSPKEIQGMMEEMEQPIAKKEGQIVAYALASSKASCLETKLLRSVVELGDTLEFHGRPLKEQRYYVMGQICIGEDCRGVGIFDALYYKHREKFATHFDCVVTEISNMNLRSLAAHRRVGFEVIHHYFDGETHWQMVAWDWK